MILFSLFSFDLCLDGDWMGVDVVIIPGSEWTDEFNDDNPDKLLVKNARISNTK